MSWQRKVEDTAETLESIAGNLVMIALMLFFDIGGLIGAAALLLAALIVPFTYLFYTISL